MEEDDDDLYAPEGNQQKVEPELKIENVEAMDEDEDDEVEDEDSDSDIEIVTEQKEIERPEQTKSVRTPLTITKPETSTPTVTGRASPAIKTAASATPPPSKPGSSYPALKTSTLDIDNKPIHEASGKPITDLDIDTDIAPDDKPWRIPGSDQTDYFNYGFDEFTWAAYCMKQSTLRTEAKEQKKAMGDFQNMFNGAPNGGAGNANPAANMMPGFPTEMSPDMQAGMQAMMASGMDPTQMDMNTFMQMMGGGQGFGGQGGQGMGGYDMYGGQQQQQQQQQQAPQQQQNHGGGRGGRRGRGRW